MAVIKVLEEKSLISISQEELLVNTRRQSNHKHPTVIKNKQLAESTVPAQKHFVD